jgi:2-keto-4-pentenoate hydratase/2-oxohepta-3-ene-1,7-dioic acid hydratase in catechol pathway
MKLVTYETAGEARLGAIDPQAGLIHPVLASDALGHNMVSLVERHQSDGASIELSSDSLPLDSVKLLAPIPRPAKNIFCVGKNYFEHAQEFTQSGFDATSKRGDNVPDNPIIFTKAPTTVTAPGDDVPCHETLSQQLDYEAELAVIIGKGGRGIAKGDAYDHVFGYTITNDVTARDLQLKHRQWFIGKSLDGSCPMGPWIASADEIDPENLNIRCWINGELRQEANSRDLIFDIPTLIETISAGIKLEPGDVISTGTPAGVGIGFDPPRFLKPGDVMKIEIDGLGTLENTIV